MFLSALGGAIASAPRPLWPCLAATLSLTGCSCRNADSPRVLRLGYFPNLTHAPALIGLARGDYRVALHSKGWSIEPVVFSAGPTAVEALFAGRVDFAYIGPGPAINGFVRSRGEALRVVSGCAANGVTIVAQAGKGWRQLADLVGKRIAVPQLGNTQYLSAISWLACAEAATSPTSRAKTKIEPVGSAEAEILMRKGQVDAAWLPEPWAARLEISGLAEKVFEEHELWPQRAFPSAVLVARLEFLRANPEVADVFIAVHERLTHELEKDPQVFAERLNEELYRLTKKRLESAVVRKALSRIKFTTDPMPPCCEHFYELARQSGFMRRAQAPPLSDIFWRRGPAAQFAKQVSNRVNARFADARISWERAAGKNDSVSGVGRMTSPSGYHLQETIQP